MISASTPFSSQFSVCARVVSLALFATTCGAVSATTVEVVSLQRSAAVLKIDGRAARTVGFGELTSEGVYVSGLDSAGNVSVRIRGVEESVGVGRLVAVSPNIAGLPALSIPKDTDGKFIAQFLALGQPFQIEVDPKRQGGLLMPAADAERLRLPYKDEPPAKGEEAKKRKKSDYPRPQKVARKGKAFLNHFTEIKTIKVGGIDLYGVKATISEDPELKRAIAGRNFLMLMNTTWEGSTLTVQRLP